MTTTLQPGQPLPGAPTETTPPSHPSGAPGAAPVVGPGRWVEHWDPEDQAAWAAGGSRLARRNLGLSVYAEFLGFCVWALWSVVVPKLPAAGIPVTLEQQFWLVSLPALVGATLRVPYSFAVTKVGGRNWTVISALLLLLPTLGLAWAISTRQAYPVLLVCAGLAGLGGGNFASSMTNISFFFPESQKGRALGINAAGGNLGTGIVQMVIPAVITVGAGLHLQNAGLVMVPLILLSAVLAWRGMDNLRGARSDLGAYRDACRLPDTWVISVLYIGTFGSFVGYSAAFPILLTSQFPERSPYIAFVGAIVGALTRPLGGAVADRLGGTRVTIASFAVMALGAVGAITALSLHSFWLFVASFIVVFAGSGIGNGATYRMIPAVFRAGVSSAELPQARRAAAACIGIAGAVGAYGGFLIPQGLRLARTELGSLVPALWVFVAAYALMALLTWVRYARRGSALAEHAV